MKKDGKRRKAFWIGVLILIIIFSFYVWFIEPNNAGVKRTGLNIGIGKPVKIVFISDIHIETISDVFLEEIVDEVNAEKADYVFLGGDYADEGAFEITRLEAFNRLKAGKGTYAVLGNHDYSVFACSSNSTINHISGFLSSQGIKVLRNEYEELEDFILVGIDDLWSCRSDYQKAMEGVNRSRNKIVLVHNSEAIPDDEFEELDLVLSGHTHCGQIRFPVLGPPLKLLGLISNQDAGLHKFDNDSYLYTTCGIGGGPRFLAPPEITVIELN